MSLVPWTAHPEVWVLLVGTLIVGGYAERVLQPKAVAAGYAPIRRSQRVWFAVGFLGIWVASDWPVHDIAEDYLYSVHMAQHLLLSMLIPAAFVLATPRWLVELLISPGSRVWNFFRSASKPIVAGLVFNGLTAFMHWSQVVQWSADNGAVHFGFHLAVFTSGLVMWMPVLGPITEWRLTPLGQCIYLFTMSIVPTVPGGWLVFAEDVVYRHYDTVDRLWGIGVLTDQQAAGAVMKLVGGFALWIIILIIFTKWAIAETGRDRDERLKRQKQQILDLDATASDLTFDAVNEAFSQSSAPSEPGT